MKSNDEILWRKFDEVSPGIKEDTETSLLEECVYFLNQIPRRHIFGGKSKDSYELAAKIDRLLKARQDDTRKDEE